MHAGRLLISLMGATWSLWRASVPRDGPRLSVADRLAMFPRRRLPIRARATIHWNPHHMPFIEAERDDDLPVVLGMVHAHLRLGQMEVMRRIAHGRIAEMAGPAAIDIDHLVRILGFGRAAPAILAAMPAESRAWLEGFVRGINAYLAEVDVLPWEFRAARLGREPWTAEDVLTVGRFVAADVTWLVWFHLIPHLGDADWAELWRALITAGAAPPHAPASDAAAGLKAAGSLFSGLGRWGSNSLAVAAARSATGGALLASDPHLGIVLPNAWLVAGYQSPSHNAVGMMIPGLPLVALGRNRRIAWGATNLHAASSDLFDAATLAPGDFATRRERLRVRWGFDRDVAIRDTPLGPVVSDSRWLADPRRRPLALRWAGHFPSDEVTALLQVSQARDWQDFQRATQGFSVPGQTFTYADVDGRIGLQCAAHVPYRAGAPHDLVLPAGAATTWRRLATAADLAAEFDPPEGCVVSANNRPAPRPVDVGCFFSPDDRYRRLRELLTGRDRIALADIMAAQRDVVVPSLVEFRDELVARMASPAAGERLPKQAADALSELSRWDGSYAADSAGALAMEQVTCRLARQLCGGRRAHAYWATWQPRDLLRRDVRAADAAALRNAGRRALIAAGKALRKFGTWGEMHRLRLAHLFGFVPLAGARHRYADFAAAGNGETVMKTACSLTGRRHAASYGSVARHISDLSDPDRNYFVLLGGQDGWPNSTTFIDQVPDWRAGRYLQMPLRVETAQRRFARKVELGP